MEAQVGENAFSTVSSKVNNFDEHEDDIRTVLRQSGVAATVENITGALHMVVGRKALEDQGRASRAAATPQIPVEDPPTPSKGKLPELSGLEKEIFDSSDMSREEWHRYKNAETFDIKVPTS